MTTREINTTILLKSLGDDASAFFVSTTPLAGLSGFKTRRVLYRDITINSFRLTASRPISGACAIFFALVPVGIEAPGEGASKKWTFESFGDLTNCRAFMCSSSNTSADQFDVVLEFPERVSRSLNAVPPGDFPAALAIGVEHLGSTCAKGPIMLSLAATVTCDGVGYF